MQTFITSHDMKENARNLDRQRLGKQRIEAIQILRTLLGISSQGWRNHPIVKMWRGHESYLLKVYLRSILDEWGKRGYRNEKCETHYAELLPLVKEEIVKPPWITGDLIRSHQSNLIRKLPSHYTLLFPGVPSDLPYLWSDGKKR
jgi:hypothetical protein